MKFLSFKHAVATQFAAIAKQPLFRVDVSKDTLWSTYLGSFPEGSNPVYRERTEHDCNCCKNFIRDLGNVVAIIDGKLVSIWDVVLPVDEVAYQTVTNAMSALVTSAPIANVFLHHEPVAGVDKSFEQLVDHVHAWDHFFACIPQQFVKPKPSLPTELGHARESATMLRRALTDFSLETVDTVLELISQGSLYRGDEHKPALVAFRKLLVAAASADLELFSWANHTSGVSRIRNTVIGSLLVDLSEGRELEYAVSSFEQKVAPANYKRPTALVTPAMVAKAKDVINELGLTSALQRRYATLTDLSINNILFADRTTRSAITGDLFDAIVTKHNKKQFDKLEEVTIDKFLSDILPTATSVELLFENRLTPNLCSIVAPVDPTARNLFKWNNPFSWSYTGDMTDAIKERVKAAGGSVVGDLCCRLAWDYTDDLDLRMTEPNGNVIYFSNKRKLSKCGGTLDVDANGGDGMRSDPVENIFYASKSLMMEGVYKLAVNNYNRRSSGTGFTVQIEFDGTTHTLHYPGVLPDGKTVTAAIISYSRATGFTFTTTLESDTSTKQVWNLQTGQFQKVNLITLSPNHWEGSVGNKHYMFMLDNCINEDGARGIYNEFLIDELTPHRKTMELVGSKLTTESSINQLSGIGLSSTAHNHVIVKVTGTFTRTIKVTI
jgi:hypothetical protein